VVLVVDDHKESAYVLKRLLMMEGYEAIAVNSGEDALRLLHGKPVSLVILDFHMPGMDGLTVLRVMRADPALRHIPVIFFSAHDGESRETALREGAAAWVIKGSLDAAALRGHVVGLIGAPAGSRILDKGPDSRAMDVG